MKGSIIFFLIVAAHFAHAQQDPLHAQYFSNPMLVNPGYTGSEDSWKNVVSYRSQWSGFDGNPTTIGFTSHTSLMENRVGLGLLVIQDQIGDTKNTEVSLSYSYRIEHGDVSFQFGLSTGFTQYRVDPSMLRLADGGDPNFANVNEMKFNTGAGILLKSDRYVVGLGVPRLLPAKITSGGVTAEIYQRHYYLHTGYLFFLSERVDFKPALLLRGTPGAPLSADVNANIEIDRTYTAGLLSRNFSTYGALLRARLKNVWIGYIFEVPTNKSVGQRFHSHEVTLALALSVFDSHTDSFSNF
ncbi:MAG TPA: type IX secretion system membrane protein PorP/SprF [Chryseosolibacter sp.]|nr:type IX secretion system membrane protein PorP/SprF [Chryseosolibacter sp.]